MGKVVPLTVQNAEIKTASVEIRSLTVAGRQVTLAVFRQLIEEDLIAHAGTLKGLPWGTVNYHPGSCYSEPHWHVVWQSGTELRRATVFKNLDYREFTSRSGTAYVDAIFRDIFAGDIDRSDCSWTIQDVTGFARTVSGVAEGVAFEFLGSSKIETLRAALDSLAGDKRTLDYYVQKKDEALAAPPKATLGVGLASLIGHPTDSPLDPPQLLESKRAARIADIERSVASYTKSVRSTEESIRAAQEAIPGTVDSLEKKWLADVRAEKKRRDQWTKTIQEIEALPQLFIAV